MAREIRVKQNFKEMITNNALYVDKSDFIREVMSKDVVLYTRPRRFGKTLNMSMLYYFFSNQEDSFNLFKDLNISKDAEAMKHLNKYPVINLSFKEINGENFEISFKSFKSLIMSFIDHNQYLFTSESISDMYKKELLKLYDKSGGIVEYRCCLKLLSECLYKHFNRGVIILVDEYDVPLDSAYRHGFYEEMTDFIRSLFSSAFKENDYLYKGIMTGCLRISKESVFTGLNNFRTDSVLSDNDEVYFGFTEDEVKLILDEYNIPDKFGKIKEWYDGYLFGDKEVYNPWSTLYYIEEVAKKPEKEPKIYWANTSGNKIIYDYIKNDTGGIRKQFELLTNGETLRKHINEQLTYRDLDDSDNIFSFLLSTGYLKCTGYNYEDDTYDLVIPNKEVRKIYLDSFKKYSRDYSTTKTPEFVKALVEGDASKANELLNGILKANISFHDNCEAFYHGYVLGTLDTYTTISNVEAGEGRLDIWLKDDKTDKKIVLEIKHSIHEEDLEKDADKAVKQIIDKQYLKADETGYGISFNRKRCCIKKV